MDAYLDPQQSTAFLSHKSINALHIVICLAIAITQKFFDHVDSDQSTHTYYHTTIITVKCSLFAKV